MKAVKKDRHQQRFRQVCAFTARTVRTRRAVGKNPIDEVNLEWIFACNCEGTEQLQI